MLVEELSTGRKDEENSRIIRHKEMIQIEEQKLKLKDKQLQIEFEKM